MFEKRNRRRSKEERSAIEVKTTSHDQTQVETVFDFHLPPYDVLSTFEVEVYMFLCPQMEFYDHALTKERFLEDVRSLTRFGEPSLSYKELQGMDSINALESPFIHLKNRVQNIKTVGVKELKEVISLCKLFSLSFSNGYLNQINNLSRQIQAMVRKESKNDTTEDVFTLLQGHYDFIKEWWIILLQIRKHKWDSPLADELQLIDEFILLRFRDGIAFLARSVTSKNAHIERPEFKPLHAKLMVWTRLVKWVFKSKNLPWIHENSTLKEKEEWVSRLGMLKKQVSKVLYIQKQKISIFALRRQFGYMLAAGIAAFWAFMANILMITYLGVGGSNIKFRDFMNIGSFWVMMFFVLAYVLKDRIKDIGRDRFGRGVLARLPDMKRKLSYENHQGNSVAVGDVSEFFTFYTSIDSVAPDILKQRRLGPGGFKIFGEHALHLKKRIKLKVLTIQRLDFHFKRVREILRISVRHFITKLDDPLQSYVYVADDCTTQKLTLPKNYAIDLVVKYKKVGFLNRQERNYYDSWKIIVNKNGIVRIDK